MENFINLLADYSLFLGIPFLFLVLVIWVYRPSAKRRYQEDADISFRDDRP